MQDLIHDGIMSDDMWDAAIYAIVAKCKAEDAKRCQAAAAKRRGGRQS
jgi:hypothetical protein